MRRVTAIVLILVLCVFSGCAPVTSSSPDGGFTVVASTYPMYVFVSRVVSGCSDVTVKLLVEQSLSCLHDYTLSVTDMKKIDSADVLVTNGAGFEAFISDVTASYKELEVVDSSVGIETLASKCSHDDHSGHEHGVDAHIWLDPMRAQMQVKNISDGLGKLLPDYAEFFNDNADEYIAALDLLHSEISSELSGISSREIITFHDGFAYLADSFGLEVLEAIEEESGSEASAAELVHICELIEEYQIPAVFTEVNGSDSSAKAISNETGVSVYSLDMIMSGSMEIGETDGYMEAMRRNAAVLKEALAS